MIEGSDEEEQAEKLPPTPDELLARFRMITDKAGQNGI